MKRMLIIFLVAAGCSDHISGFATSDVCAKFPNRACLQYSLGICNRSADSSTAFDQLGFANQTDQSGPTTFLPVSPVFSPATPSPGPLLQPPVEIALVPDATWPGGRYNFSVCAYANGRLIGDGGNIMGFLNARQHDKQSTCLNAPEPSIMCPSAPKLKTAQTDTQKSILNLWAFGTNVFDVFAVGFGGLILHSSDNGATFTTQTSPATKRLDGVWGSSDANVYLAGANGVILHSANHGTTWEPQTNPMPTTALHRIFGTSAGNIFIVGDSGLLLHSDGSGTWTQRTISTNDLWGIWGDAPNNLFVVGFNGTALRSTDGGVGWTQVNGQFGGVNLTAIWGLNKDIFIVGYDGNIFYGDGVGFGPRRDPSNTFEQDMVWGSSGSDVWVAGNNGNILHSVDRGMTWQHVGSGTAGNLYAVFGLAANNVFFGGDGGLILRGP